MCDVMCVVAVMYQTAPTWFHVFQGVNGASYPGEYVHQPGTGDVTTVDGRHFSDVHIDLRAYKICKWDANIGQCDSSNGIHQEERTRGEGEEESVFVVVFIEANVFTGIFVSL